MSFSPSFSANELAEVLDLIPHPEGGFFRETYRSDTRVREEGLDKPYSASTAIYFLLSKGDFSAFHRIRFDEVWHFYLGGPLCVVEIDEEGLLKTTILGTDILNNQSLQYTVKAGRWFASYPLEGSEYSLVGCSVSPGFEFSDFEMAKREELIKEFPALETVIRTLTR